MITVGVVVFQTENCRARAGLTPSIVACEVVFWFEEENEMEMKSPTFYATTLDLRAVWAAHWPPHSPQRNVINPSGYANSAQI